MSTRRPPRIGIVSSREQLAVLAAQAPESGRRAGRAGAGSGAAQRGELGRGVVAHLAAAIEHAADLPHAAARVGEIAAAARASVGQGGIGASDARRRGAARLEQVARAQDLAAGERRIARSRAASTQRREPLAKPGTSAPPRAAAVRLSS